MLPLHGFAKRVYGFTSTDQRAVFRLCSPTKVPVHSADVALVRDANELVRAQSSGFDAAIIISGSEPPRNGNPTPRRVIQLATGMVGIPIYSAVDTVHDYVVQAKGAFDETVLGVLKLKDRGQRVEIRVVLHAITAPRLLATSQWLARNLPFVDHVALMGLENTGFAVANDHLLWIDPLDYKEQLTQSVELLSASKVRVSVYNLPRCLLDRSVWPYARQSISDWKNAFVAECARCDEKPKCSGFFTTGRPRYSRGIKAITGTSAPLNGVPA